MRGRRRDRRPPRSALSDPVPPSHMVRRNQSFFGSLFDRPQRRRAVRHATNLVRRLSQSRLFLNVTRTTNSSEPTTPITATPPTDTAATQMASAPLQMVVDLSTAPQLAETVANCENAPAQVIGVRRAESPPPAYEKVVKLEL